MAGAGGIKTPQRKYDVHPLLRNQRRAFFICQKVVESRMMLLVLSMCLPYLQQKGGDSSMNDNISAFIISVDEQVWLATTYANGWIDDEQAATA